jgi:hypothetical protein
MTLASTELGVCIMKSLLQDPHSGLTASLMGFLLLCSTALAQKSGPGMIPDQPPQNHRSSAASTLSNGFASSPGLLFKQSAFSFLPSRQVNVDNGNQVNDFGPVIAVSKNGDIYVVWNGDETIKTIFFSRSTDGGTTFSAPTKINDDVAYPPSYSVYQPDIALDGDGTIYVVWHDYRQWTSDDSWTSPIDVFMDHSTDGGLTWNTDVQVSSGNGTYPWHFQPSIAVDGNNGNIFVSFTDYDRYYPQGDQGDISVVASFNHGVSFQSKVRVDDAPDALYAIQTFSSIAVDSIRHNVLVVFDDSRNGSKDIYLAKSTDSAQSFLPNVLVNQDTTNDQEEPSVRVAHAGDVYVVWKDWSADSTPTAAPYQNDMVLAKSTDGGGSFRAGVKINDTYLNAEYSYNFPPRLAVDDSGHVHVTWFDSRFNYTNCFYDESVDGGQTFSEDAIVNDNRDSLSHSLPRIAVGNGHAYVVYIDKRNGNGLYDIFFAAKDQFTGVGEVAALPRTFSLEQNYPNPFNPVTTVEFRIQSSEFVILKVFDLLGREVATLVNEVKQPGTYIVQWDATGMASGVYFYRLGAPGFIQTRKLLLLR